MHKVASTLRSTELRQVLEDDEHLDNPDSDRTITVSVEEGGIRYILRNRLPETSTDGSKVKAQTLDGTRVPTPTPAKSRPPASSANRSSMMGSYAATVKSKPNDWHLEFFMDNHKLPLDLTIYGAVHQHEGCKQSGPLLSLSMIRQGMYTVKFKKVSGPAPASDSEVCA